MTMKRHFEVEGYFTLEAVRPDGTVRKRLRFKNLITNNGLDLIGSSGAIWARAAVGTGTATPANTDTGLATFLTSTSTITGTPTSGTQVATAPKYVWERYTYQFAIGIATGNLTEVGMTAAAAGSNTNFFSHALILDGGGAPTTFTVLSSEALNVTYEFRMYFVDTDPTNVVTIAGVNYTFTTRPASIANWLGSTSGAPAGNQIVQTLTAYNGSMGAITTTPSGTSGGQINSATPTYTGGSYQMTYVFSIPLGSWNLASPFITALSLSPSSAWRTAGLWQWGVSPAIPKDATKTLSLTVVITWARH